MSSSIFKPWDFKKLEDVAEVVDSLHKTPSYVDSGLPMVRVTDIKGGFLKLSECKRVTKEVFHEFTRKYLPRKGDILLSRVGTYGVSSYASTDEEFCLGQNTVVIKPKINSRYLYLCLNSPYAKHQIEGFAVGSTQKTISLKSIKSLEIPIPEKQEIEAIAHILGTLDDKIELNQQMNQTLEAIARALFKSWFIDFDPVRAKLDGRQPAGMDAETAALFPAEFEDSALGKIPKDWKVQIIGDVIEFAYGKPLKQPDRQHGIVPVYGSNGQIGWHNKSLVKAPGIVIGRKGNPGTVVWTPIDFYPIDTTFYAIPISSTKSLHYLFHALCLQDLPSLAADSAVPGLNRNLAYMNKLLIPSEECLEAFDSIVNGISAKVHITNQEAITLTSIRDALLPKLLSGEIRVQDAETVVEAVT